MPILGEPRRRNRQASVGMPTALTSDMGSHRYTNHGRDRRCTISKTDLFHLKKHVVHRLPVTQRREEDRKRRQCPRVRDPGPPVSASAGLYVQNAAAVAAAVPLRLCTSDRFLRAPPDLYVVYAISSGGVEDNVHGQADDHDAQAIYREEKGALSQSIVLDVLEVPSPLLPPLARVQGDAGHAS